MKNLKSYKRRDFLFSGLTFFMAICLCSMTFVAYADEAFDVSGVLNKYEKVQSQSPIKDDESRYKAKETFYNLREELESNFAKSPQNKTSIANELGKRAREYKR